MAPTRIRSACNGSTPVSSVARNARSPGTTGAVADDRAGGGIPTSTNRTKWPVSGGGVGFQPGWFPGHSQGMFWINLGYDSQPQNMSNVMVGPIGFTGPTNDPYPNESVCWLQTPLPTGYHPNIGDNATIQVVMLAQHGAALYSVRSVLNPPRVPQIPH